MTALPKRFLVLGATVQTALAARRLKRPRTAVPEQSQAFADLVAGFSQTQYGRTHGIEDRMDYASFQRSVPVRTHAQLAPWIDRMIRGEAGVLWPGPCNHFATTAGTVSVTPKTVPVTPDLLAHFRRAAYDALLFHAMRAGDPSIFRGRHLYFGLASTLTSVQRREPPAATVGELSAILGAQLPAWSEEYFYEPGRTIDAIPDWTARIAATVERTRHQNITLFAGLPNWLVVMAEALRQQAASTQGPAASLRSIWPELECVMHTGIPIAPFQEELRRLVGASVKFHEVYFASEGFIAAQDADAAAGLRLLTDAGLFYEFIPWSEFDETTPAALGARAVPLEQVRAGVDYAILLTTPGGLCRYVLEDVVRFVSVEPPRLIYVGRTGLQLNTFGERVLEKDLTDSLVIVCHRHNWTITNFHVAPLTTSSLTGQIRGRHEWWVELQPGTLETPTGPILAAQVDAELCARNAAYADKRKAGVIDAPVVRLVMPHFFEHWLRSTGRERGQGKLPRSRNDREIADALATIACFTADE